MRADFFIVFNLLRPKHVLVGLFLFCLHTEMFSQGHVFEIARQINYSTEWKSTTFYNGRVERDWVVSFGWFSEKKRLKFLKQDVHFYLRKFDVFINRFVEDTEKERRFELEGSIGRVGAYIEPFELTLMKRVVLNAGLRAEYKILDKTNGQSTVRDIDAGTTKTFHVEKFGNSINTGFLIRLAVNVPISEKYEIQPAAYAHNMWNDDARFLRRHSKFVPALSIRLKQRKKA